MFFFFPSLYFCRATQCGTVPLRRTSCCRLPPPAKVVHFQRIVRKIFAAPKASAPQKASRAFIYFFPPFYILCDDIWTGVFGTPPPRDPFFFFSCLFLLPRPCSHHPPLLQTYRSSHDQSRRVGLFSFLLFLLLTFIISSSVSTLLRARFLALHLFRSKRQKPSARAYFCGRWWQSCFFPCCLGFP